LKGPDQPGHKNLMEETCIQTNGIRLHVMQDGPKDGRPVLLLHGFPEFWCWWA